MKLTASLFAAVACVVGLIACAWTPRGAHARAEPANVAVEDSVLFSAVLPLLEKASGNQRFRIDPRPLPPDASLISPGLRMGSRSDSASWEAAVFGAIDSAVVQTRRRILARRRIQEGDVVLDSRCPGAMLPATKERMAVLARDCPAESSYSIAIALPRPDRTGVSPIAIRVITLSLSPNGASHSSADYVFLKESSGVRFVKRVPVAVVE